MQAGCSVFLLPTAHNSCQASESPPRPSVVENRGPSSLYRRGCRVAVQINRTTSIGDPAGRPRIPMGRNGTGTGTGTADSRSRADSSRQCQTAAGLWASVPGRALEGRGFSGVFLEEMFAS